MAKPRVFISSTFYDLRQIREDLERFIKDLGYEPVRNETGSIPYGKDEPPEAYAYREVELCDIIVAIIGGRFGSESQQISGYSISQVELRRALDRGIQVFIFIESGVLAEYSTYLVNKTTKGMNYKFADDVRVYKFIEDLYQLPSNNPIAKFETSADISQYLKAQWAGLFQRFLQEQQRLSEIKVLDEMKSVSATLHQLVSFLTEERTSKDEAIQSILLMNHPAFRRLKALTATPYRVFFINRGELNAWLKSRGWELTDISQHDEDSLLEWNNAQAKKYLKLVSEIFDDDGKLKNYTEDEWNDSWFEVREYPAYQPPPEEEDDIPF